MYVTAGMADQSLGIRDADGWPVIKSTDTNPLRGIEGRAESTFKASGKTLISCCRLVLPLKLLGSEMAGIPASWKWEFREDI